MENKKINWYPGHMFKAKKELQENLKQIDAVIEVVDARVPISSHNEMLEEITQNKPKLILFSKIDLVENSELAKYEHHYQKLGYKTLKINIHKTESKNKVIKEIEELCNPMIEKYLKKGITRSMRVLVMGMPNVGKSSLINLMAGKKKLIIGNRPGVTKAQKLIKIDEKIELVDTPGILIPKIEDLEMGYNLVLNSLIKDEVVELEEIGYYLLTYLIKNKSQTLMDRYNKLTEKDLNPFKEGAENFEDIENVYIKIEENIGGYSKKKGPDYEKITIRIINDYRQQKFGKIILDEL